MVKMQGTRVFMNVISARFTFFFNEQFIGSRCFKTAFENEIFFCLVHYILCMAFTSTLPKCKGPVYP